jgi:hypothetical protein
MTDTPKENKKTFRFSTLIITYLIVTGVRLLTGFHYDFSEGLVNFKFLIDIALWLIVYYAVDLLLRKVFFKRYFD